jgi:hypothetical protein
MRFHHFYYSEGDGGGQVEQKTEKPAEAKSHPETKQPAAKQPETKQPEIKPQSESRQQLDAAEFADALMKAIDDRTSRAEKGVLKSMAEQYGFTEDEAKAVKEKAKADKAAKLPEDVQKQLDEANAKVRRMQVSAEVVKIGAELGLVDADVALQLLPADAIKVNAKGEISGVKEALEALKKEKPYLFGTKAAGGIKQGAGAPPEKDAKSEIMETMYHKQ